MADKPAGDGCGSSVRNRLIFACAGNHDGIRRSAGGDALSVMGGDGKLFHDIRFGFGGGDDGVDHRRWFHVAINEQDGVDGADFTYAGTAESGAGGVADTRRDNGRYRYPLLYFCTNLHGVQQNGRHQPDKMAFNANRNDTIL